ncbi:hypothetical protein AMJ85_03260 [candidate division BRC1 bacterium SM23_51]|nr:MAG: hypothetical protein AMJ85_03260 [candidate division BRC1 bacterium SM23_51]
MAMTRRKFIGATAVGTLAMAAVRRGVASSESLPHCPSGKIRVRKIYLAKPVPTWPTPKLDVPAEIRRVDGEIAKLQGEMPDIEFTGGELFRTTEDLSDNLKERIGDVDAVLVFNLTSTVGHLVRAVAEVGKPTILFSQPYSGHDWSGVATLQEQGNKIECLATSDWHELVDAMRPIRAIRRMKESRVVYLRNGEANKTYVGKAKDILGVDIISINEKRLNAAYKAADEKEARAFADRWIQGAIQVVEPTREEVIKSGRLYLAMRRLLAEEQAQAIAINCLGLFGAGKLPAYPCIGFSQLNNDLFVGACEADLDSTLTMLLFRYMVNQPGFISDPVVDTATNSVIHAHCVSATKMAGPDAPAAPYIIRSHLEDDKGAALQVKMRIGQTITMTRLVGNQLILVSTGTITDTPDVDRGCRTKITTRVADARKILEGYHHGLHRVIYYGDHVLDVKRLTRFLPALKVVEEG